MKEKKIKAICCASLLFGLIMCFSSCDTLSGDIGESSTGEENTIETVLESDEENTSDSVSESGEESTYEIILDGPRVL